MLLSTYYNIFNKKIYYLILYKKSTFCIEKIAYINLTYYRICNII
ncbi:MAG: hypothetical protein JWQ14_952 [Adhaeribacter sp.]|nr:hypothetical protein [Adhaeribacter sp.]